MRAISTILNLFFSIWLISVDGAISKRFMEESFPTISFIKDRHEHKKAKPKKSKPKQGTNN
jgi:hypothetical protein